MEAIPKNPIIQHEPNTLEQVRKIFNLDKPGQMDESIDILQEWVKKQPHFNKKDFDRAYLEGYIIRAKGSVEKAKKRLESMCTLRTVFSHLFKDNKPNQMKNIEAIKEFMFPKQTKDYCTVYFSKLCEPNVDDSFILSFFTKAEYIVDFLSKYDYNAGIIYVIDMTEADLLKYITIMASPFVRQSFTIFFKAYGARIRAVNLITKSKLIENFLTLLKPLLGDKVDRIFVHTTRDSLYEQIEKDMWPAEYGGKEESIDVLSKRMIDFLSSDEMKNYRDELNKGTVDTKIKPIAEEYDTHLGIPGSFRKIAVD
ncbi:unnamed protein product [Diatraea saccharalis]|uniref:CRAL-TRIO domain-containing protein n=1 Tax=Diatraea saccharalis TaxID=40085 RepID=A0A9N9WHY4_9NEOP|nr:unnamed protein product [Diatraea saccharalis]